MKPYADTNFFTRVYLALPESAKADRLVEAARTGKSQPLPITWLHRIELTNAIELSVWLCKQGGHPTVNPEQAAAALATFQEDVKERAFLQASRPDLGELEGLFEQLSLRLTAKHGFRTYDILHVGSARLLGCDQFFSFDERARKLARLEGFEVPD
jgi:predicted nucleic acid-binding protein